MQWAEDGARKAARQWAQTMYRIRGTYLENEATFFDRKMEWRAASTSTGNPDEKKFIVDSGASVHMMSKMGSSPEELETVNVSRRTTTVITADGSMNATEEAMVYVKEMDMFVTVQLLQDTPAVLSLGKLCEEKSIYMSGQKGSELQSYQKSQKNVPCCKCDNFVPIVVLVYQVKHTSRVQHKIQLKPPRSRH